MSWIEQHREVGTRRLPVGIVYRLVGVSPLITHRSGEVTARREANHADTRR